MFNYTKRNVGMKYIPLYNSERRFVSGSIFLKNTHSHRIICAFKKAVDSEPVVSEV